jgi:alkylation response protein AidB-like acyl-CoA dehydrogenase
VNRPPSNPLLAEVAPLFDGLAAGAVDSDDARRFPAEQAAALASAGVFRATVPRSLGGLETPLPELTEVIEAVARRHGSANCAWLLGGALVIDDDGEVVTGPSGPPEMRLCFAPADEVGIVSNRDVLGMRGTGSDDLVMDGVRVPRERTVSLVRAEVGRAEADLRSASAFHRDEVASAWAAGAEPGMLEL